MACIIPATPPPPFVEDMSVPEKKGDEFRRFLFSYSQDLESLRIIFPKLTVSQRYYAAEIFYLNYNWESLLLALEFINELQLLPYQLENLFSRIIDQEDLSRRFVAHFSAEQRDRFLYFAFNTGKIEVERLMEFVGAREHVTFGGRLERDARGFVASAMAKGTLRIFASVCARSVFPEPVGPRRRMLLFATSTSSD